MKYLLTAFALISVLAQPALASSHDEIQELKQEIRGLMERLEALEEQAAQQPAPVPVAETRDKPKKSMDTPKWVNNIGIKGDLRLRHEQIDQEMRDGRTRQRVRARVELSGKVNDNIKASVRLATGGDDPVSTNQTFDSGASSKGIRLDRAYITANAGENTKILGGKTKNPFHRPGGNGLIWDGDLNPEGVAVNYKNGNFFANGMGFWLEERSSDDDSLMFGAQFGYSGETDGGTKLTGGIGYYDYQETKGRSPLFDPTDSFGNTLDVNGNYMFDYDILQVFGELSMKLNNGQPLSFFADYVQNGDAELDTGYAVGLKYGKASKPRTWDLGYVYQDLEADAVLGLFTDSDFGGGGTDSNGHVFKFGYAFNKNFSGKLTYFLNEINQSAATQLDYDRLQADLIFKY